VGGGGGHNIRQFMKAGRGSAVLVQLIILYMPSHILFELH
jgi:hypothetical protein